MESKVEMIISSLVVIAGIALLFCGLYIEPPGEIDYSLLVAYGETLTFAGSIIGVDYHYRIKLKDENAPKGLKLKDEKKEETKEERNKVNERKSRKSGSPRQARKSERKARVAADSLQGTDAVSGANTVSD